MTDSEKRDSAVWLLIRSLVCVRGAVKMFGMLPRAGASSHLGQVHRLTMRE